MTMMYVFMFSIWEHIIMYMYYIMLIFVWRLSLTDTYNEDVDPKKKLDDLIHLAELCIEVLQQNEEYHAEVRLNTTTKINPFW